MSKREVLSRALECFADPARHDSYFDLYSEDAVLHGYPGVEPGLASIRKFYADAIWSAFPDARVDAEILMEDESKIACRFVLTGTHKGTLMGGIPATGKAIALPGITVLRFEGGKCVERWSCADFLVVLGQIGVFPPAAG